MFPSSSPTRFNALVVYILISRTQSQYCYYPSSNASTEETSLAQGHRPCDPYAQTSLCCPIGWTCFSNKICVVTDSSAVKNKEPVGTQIRGTCTDPDWNTEKCGDFCLDEPVNDNDGSLTPCGDNVYCCTPEGDSGACDCGSGKGVFSLTMGTAQTVIGAIGSKSTNTPFVTVSSSMTSSTASKTASSTSVSTTTSATKASATTASATPTHVPITEQKSFKIGLPVGLILGLGLLATLSALLITSHRRMKDRDAQRTNAHQLSPFQDSRNYDNNTLNSQDTKVAIPPYPHPYSPPASPPPNLSRSGYTVFGPTGVPADDPYHQTQGVGRISPGVQDDWNGLRGAGTYR